MSNQHRCRVVKVYKDAAMQSSGEYETNATLTAVTFHLGSGWQLSG